MSAELAVRGWANIVESAIVERDIQIRKMRAEGATLRAIADAAGISHTAVAKIVADSARP